MKNTPDKSIYLEPAHDEIRVKKKRKIDRFLCDACDIRFSTQKKFKKHICSMVVHEVKYKDLKCDVCDVSFDSEKMLINHSELVHEVKKCFTCIVCKVGFNLKRNLDRHIRHVHEKEKPFKCAFCTQIFSYKQVLSRHIAAMHKDVNQNESKLTMEQIYPCHICEKSFIEN